MTDTPPADAEVVDATIVDEPAEHPPTAAPAPAPVGAELIHRPTGSTELIHADTPRDRIAQAQEMAAVLNDVIVQTGARTKVGSMKVRQPDGSDKWEDRYHVNVEGWQTLATLLGVALVERHVRPVLDPATGRPLARHTRNLVYARGTRKDAIRDGSAIVERAVEYDGHDWEAVVDAYKDGVLIASGSGLCSRSETTWADRDEFSLRSMASTRATSRAMKGAAAWIVTLAGYSSTPAEEMPRDQADDQAAAAATLPLWAQPAAGDAESKALAALTETIGEADALDLITKIKGYVEGTLPKVATRTILGIASRIPPMPAPPAAAEQANDEPAGEPPPARRFAPDKPPPTETSETMLARVNAERVDAGASALTRDEKVEVLREAGCTCEDPLPASGPQLLDESCPFIDHGIPF